MTTDGVTATARGSWVSLLRVPIPGDGRRQSSGRRRSRSADGPSIAERRPDGAQIGVRMVSQSRTARRLAVAVLVGALTLVAGTPAAEAETIGLDVAFAGGKVVVDIGPIDRGGAVAVQAEGSVVVGGGARRPNGHTDMVVNRFRPDGRPDPTFGVDGQLLLPRLAQPTVDGLAIQSDGRILVTTLAQTVRLLADGQLDPCWGAGRTVAAAWRWRSCPTAGSSSPARTGPTSLWLATTLMVRPTRRLGSGLGPDPGGRYGALDGGGRPAPTRRRPARRARVRGHVVAGGREPLGVRPRRQPGRRCRHPDLLPERRGRVRPLRLTGHGRPPPGGRAGVGLGDRSRHRRPGGRVRLCRRDLPPGPGRQPAAARCRRRLPGYGRQPRVPRRRPGECREPQRLHLRPQPGRRRQPTARVQGRLGGVRPDGIAPGGHVDGAVGHRGQGMGDRPGRGRPGHGLRVRRWRLPGVDACQPDPARCRSRRPVYGPEHGFEAFFPGTSTGMRTICAFAINQAAGVNSLLDCIRG